VFVIPKAYVLPTAAKVPGLDGEKMSKSYNNHIEIFESPKEMRKKVMRIATDSRPMDQAKEPDGDLLYELYSLFVDEPSRDELAAKYRRGGFGYGEVKKQLADAAEAYFTQAHERRQKLVANPDEVRQILAAGAAKARAKAAQVLARAQDACGVTLNWKR
jgi:tryptophanyl-tRNA synthetase